MAKEQKEKKDAAAPAAPAAPQAPDLSWWEAAFPPDHQGKPTVTGKLILEAFGSYEACLDTLISGGIPEAYAGALMEIIPPNDVQARAMVRLLHCLEDIRKLGVEQLRVGEATLEILRSAGVARG